MKIKKGNVKDLGSCNFCNGELTPSGYGINYKYNTVYQITGSYLQVIFCENCIDKIRNIEDFLTTQRVTEILLDEELF